MTDRYTSVIVAPNDTGYKRWSCHSGLKLLCKLCRTSPPPALGARFTVFLACRPCGPAGWLALLLTKAGDVETNPGPTTLNKKVWICDICHKQIHVRKQISIKCNRIEHWVHLRCAGVRQAQYTDTWTCHLHRESRLTPHTDITPPHRSRPLSKPPTQYCVLYPCCVGVFGMFAIMYYEVPNRKTVEGRWSSQTMVTVIHLEEEIFDKTTQQKRTGDLTVSN